MEITSKPVCSVFGECGGCQYQDIPYPEELDIKNNFIRDQFSAIQIENEKILPIVPSPQIYQYRNQLDFRLQRTRQSGILMGFSQSKNKRMTPVEACPVAVGNLSDFIPGLKEEAIRKLPPKYYMANVVVRTGDDGRVCWGGIGKRSLQLQQEDYLWVEIEGKRVFYSLDTFFQANRSILPLIIQKVRSSVLLDKADVFFDLYAGVGLFGLFLADQMQKVVMIEENLASTKIAKYNIEYNKAENIDVVEGKVEEVFSRAWEAYPTGKKAALIDPPRGGLKEETALFLASCRELDSLHYLSCSAETLVHDLAILIKGGWKVKEVCPFDFFPRTKHVEIFVSLERK